jgi:hypothetical protein
MWFLKDPTIFLKDVRYFWNGNGPSSAGVVLFGTLGIPGGHVIFRPKKVSETIGYPVSFVSALAPGETIVSATVTATVYSGNDPSPQSIVDGAATFSGAVVNQGITGGVAGTSYNLQFIIVTSLNQEIDTSGRLVVEPNS